MPDLIFVRPADGARVRQPERDFALLPAEGDNVERNTFWLRRIADGDVLTTPLEAQKPATGKTTTKG